MDLTRLVLREGKAMIESPFFKMPAAKVPLKPRKSKLGRLTHCTGKRRWAKFCASEISNDRQVAGRCPGRHVAGVLFMARRVGNDEFALGGGEIPVGYVDGDALLALGLQAVHQKGKVDVAASGPGFEAILLDGCELVFIDHFRIVQQPPDQGAFAVINATTSEEAQHFLAFMLGQIGHYVTANQIRLV